MSRIQPHFTPARRAGDFIFVSGQLPFDENMTIVAVDIEVQTRQVIRNIERALASVDCDLSHVVKTMVWLTDPEDFPRFNSTYAGMFQQDPPARATVGTTLMVTGAKIEIEAIAYDPR